MSPWCLKLLICNRCGFEQKNHIRCSHQASLQRLNSDSTVGNPTLRRQIALRYVVDGLKLHRLALAQNISLAPGHMFSADHRFTHCLRLNFGHADDPRFNHALRTVGLLAASLVGG